MTEWPWALTFVHLLAVSGGRILTLMHNVLGRWLVPCWMFFSMAGRFWISFDDWIVRNEIPRKLFWWDHSIGESFMCRACAHLKYFCHVYSLRSDPDAQKWNWGESFLREVKPSLSFKRGSNSSLLKSILTGPKAQTFIFPPVFLQDTDQTEL